MYHCLKLHSVITLPLLFHLALSSDQPASSITVPVTAPHTPLVQRYIDYLKYSYINTSPLLKETVVKVRPKEFIHLNLVSDAAQEEEEVKSQCLLLQLRGDVAAIRKKRRPMEMEDIGISEDQSVAKKILVEGSPGIGKTMFSWELCRQWAEGKMLQDRDIVLMLQLRDKRVREAKNLSDLFHHDDESIKLEVFEHIISVDGRGVFLVLEGYDELTEDQRAEGSILNRLLIGKCLPKASIMVTSRPLASDSLCPDFKESVDQHMVIVGFNDEDIKSYMESACQNLKQPQIILADLLSYVSSNPFVSSLMHIPLQCAKLTALYIEKWKMKKGLYAPTTLTQLYTDLLLSSLIRYMRDNPIYSKCKIRQLSDLPSEVQEKLSKLSQLAAEGLEKRQFIFDTIPCDHMGLMQSTEEELVIGGSALYCFLHLTLQEYLAALHWSRMGPEDLVRLVSETSLFPLDTLVKDGITEATQYHWPALYFLSGLTSIPTELLKGCLTAAVTKLKDDSIKYILQEMPSLLPAFSASFGAEYNPYFFQLLFESQSRELVAELFIGDLCNPMSTNPLECFVTAWCVANSSPKSRWLVRFGDVLALEKFVENFNRFVCCSTESRHGTIAGLYVRDCKFQAARWKALPSLPSVFRHVEYLGIRDILVADIAHFVPLFSIVRKFASLKVLQIWIEGDDGVLPEVTIPPQHCPSLFTLTISGTASLFLVQCFALANINTLTTLECPLPTNSFNLSSLCACLGQTASLKVLIITDTDVTTREAKELARALEKNRSLVVLGFRAYSVTITDEADRILEEVLISRPFTLRKFFLKADYMPVCVDPKLALDESQAMSAVERQTGIEEDEELLSLIEQ